MNAKPYNGDQYLEARVRVIENLLQEREKMVRLTAESLEMRLAHLNELRGDVMTKTEYARAHESFCLRLERLEQMQSRFIGVAIALVAMGGAAGAMISKFIK